MQLLADYFPLLLFFVAFKWQGIWVATAVAIVASIVQIVYFHWKRKVSAVHWISLVVIVVFGAVLAAGKLVWRRDLLGYLMKDLHLPPAIWTRLTWSWVAFFAAMAAANWYVAFHFATDTWVNFKVWGGIGLFLAFALAQGVVLARYVTEPSR